MQFNSSTANLGNGLGVGSGIASTVLSVVGIRKQRGPGALVGRMPNMLAPVFGKPTALNAYYPPAVLAYLSSAPGTPSSQPATRLELLQAEWQKSGRIGAPQDAATQRKITKLTASENTNVRLTIDDITDRIAMLTDVGGRVGLMKRDLGGLMHTVAIGGGSCGP